MSCCETSREKASNGLKQLRTMTINQMFDSDGIRPRGRASLQFRDESSNLLTSNYFWLRIIASSCQSLRYCLANQPLRGTEACFTIVMYLGKIRTEALSVQGTLCRFSGAAGPAYMPPKGRKFSLAERVKQLGALVNTGAAAALRARR